MNVWLSLPFLAAPDLRELSVIAEDAGVAGVALSDHVCIPARNSSPYPYGANGPVDLPPETEYPDPVVAIASLGASTKSLRFMTAVLIAPLRHPIALAKSVATVSSMCGGRIDLGVGVGWLQEEFEAVGLPYFKERGRAMDEMLPLLRRLWSGDLVEHHGDHFDFDAVAINPRPAERVPILIGGHSQIAVRRAAAMGDGWVGVNPTIEELESIVERLRRAREESGRGDQPFTIRTGLRGALTPERVGAARSLGVDSLLIAPWQIGDRRDSVYDQPVAVIAQALPSLVDEISAA